MNSTSKTFFSASLVMGFSVCCSQAQPLRGVTKLEDYGVEVNIGQRRSVMSGSRDSLKVLSRLAKNYPKLSFYKVKWTAKLPKGIVRFESVYDKSHRNASREAYADNAAFTDNLRYGLDEVTDQDLQVVARRGGSFSDLEKRVLKRKGIRR